MKAKRLVLIVCFFAALSSVARAVQVESLKKARRAAPEYIRLKVYRVRKETQSDWSSPTLLWAESEVIKVYRSRTGLKAGERITIIYATYDEEQLARFAEQQKNAAGGVGVVVSALYPPEAKEGHTYRAFLRRQEGNSLYVPAADEHSLIAEKR